MKTAAAFFLFLAMLGCAKPKPQAVPPPPAQEEKTPVPVYPKQAPLKAGDIAVKGCAVTSMKDNKADCICRHAKSHLDAADSSKPMVMSCREEKK